MDSECKQRTKTRQMDITAASKALAFLSTDEATDLFANTFNTHMLQVQSSHGDAVVKALQQHAIRLHSPQLSALVIKARLDSFSKVKEHLQGMIVQLKERKWSPYICCSALDRQGS